MVSLSALPMPTTISTNEQCVFTTPYTGGNSSHYNVAGSNGVGTAVAGPGSQAVNLFKDPEAVWNQVRAPILGIDSKNPGVGPIIGTPYWNVDMSVEKSVKVYESVALQFSVIFTNVFNHDVLGDPAMTLYDSSTWGVQNAQDEYSPQDGVRHARELLNRNSTRKGPGDKLPAFSFART